MTCVWVHRPQHGCGRSEDNSKELILPFHFFMGSGESNSGCQASMANIFLHLLSQLSSPPLFFKFFIYYYSLMYYILTIVSLPPPPLSP